MAPRRSSIRFSTGLLAAAACLAGGILVVSAAPEGEPQVKGAQVPNVVAPRVGAKSIPVPVAGQSPARMTLPVMSAERLAAFEEAAARGLDYLPGQVLVKFKPGVNRAGQQRALQALRSRPDASVLEWIGDDLALLKDTVQPDAGILSDQLAAQPEVAYAQPNYLMEIHATPNDPSYSARQWNLRAINMQRAWDIAPGGSNSVIVAVIDSGVTTVAAQNVNTFTWNGSAIVQFAMPIGLSPDFDASRFVSPRDFTISPSSPSTLVVDTDSHGTHVAGTVGENTNNNVALAGIAYNTRIMPLKACMSYWDRQFARSAAGTPGFTTGTTTLCSSDSVVAAFRFAADNGANVINYSAGSNSPNTAARDAIAYAISKGVFIAISNGNDATDGNEPSYPAYYAPDFNGMMSVAATGQTNQHAIYSTTNDHTEISAPGGDNSVGDVVWQASILSTDSIIGSTIFPRFDRYSERGKQGTSMASPHVAGIAALIASRGITNPAAIEAILRQTARDLGATGKDVQFGHGLVQPFYALFGQGIRR